MTAPTHTLRFPDTVAEPFGVYVHVPFCASRCGYCDFNTYTAGELGSSASPQSWAEAARREIRAAAQVLSGRMRGGSSTSTVFFGGGTPSLVGAEMLGEILGEIRDSLGLAADAEVTTEANPESVSPEFFAALREAGFTRISLGMQSTAPGVLQILDRKHTPGRALEAAREACQAGFEHVNLDIIYGTPGESEEDLARTIDDALGTGVDHISAYSLIVEDGTALARRVRRREIAEPDEDVFARRYEMLATRLEAAGMDWYEVSNWARGSAGQCRHNLGYWRDGDWWGVGPGAHGHLSGQRWWNHKHPARYAQACAAGELPVAGGEVVAEADRHVERVMLRLRLAEGIAATELSGTERARLEAWIARGHVERAAGRFRITASGRLLVDGIVRDILDD